MAELVIALDVSPTTPCVCCRHTYRICIPFKEPLGWQNIGQPAEQERIGQENEVAAAIREDVQLRWSDYSNLMQEMMPTYTDLQLSKLRAAEPWSAEEVGFLLPPR